MADQGPPLNEIAAARHKLHERQAEFMEKAQGHDSDASDKQESSIQHGLKEAKNMAQELKSKVLGGDTAPKQPLPGHEGEASKDVTGSMRAHSPVELPTAPREMPAFPASHQPPTSPPRIPSGVILCSRGSHATEPLGPSPLAATSMPGSSMHELHGEGHPTVGEEVDNAMEAALAGSAGLEAGHNHAPHGHTFQAAVAPAQHVPHTAHGHASAHAHPAGGGGGASQGPSMGGALLSRVMAPFVAHAGGRGDPTEDPAAPQHDTQAAAAEYDSNQMMNMGPGSDNKEDYRATTGGVTMFLGALSDKLHGAVEAGAAMLGSTPASHEPDVRPEDLPGMPGSLPIDQEIREMRMQQAEEAAAQRQAQRDAVREEAQGSEEPQSSSAVEDMRELNAAMGQEPDARTAQPSVSGGGGESVLGKLSHKVADVLHLHKPAEPVSSDKGGQHPEGVPQPADYREQVGQQSAAERRADVPVPVNKDTTGEVDRADAPPGTADVERPPARDVEEVREQKGIPQAALHASAARDDMNTKEGGQFAPAGALGQHRPKPDAHTQAYAPEANQPNFFEEVNERGLADVLQHGAYNIKDSISSAIDRRGGEPAPLATTAGGVSDTSEIFRNVERVDVVQDDPQQRKIYDAETYKVPAVHPKVVHDTHSEGEKINEAAHAVTLGKNKPISGAVPHDKPEMPIGDSEPGSATKDAAGRSMFDQIGTAKGRGPEGSTSVRDAAAPFLDHKDAVEPQGPFWSAVLARIIPTAKAVGGASAGTPTGTDRSQRPPTADYGDNTSGRTFSSPKEEHLPKEHGIPAPGGYAPGTPHADVKRAHPKDEPPTGKTNVPERVIAEEVKSTIMGGPEAAGIPRRGVDEPGGLEAVYNDLGEKVSRKVEGVVKKDDLADSFGRVGESLGGAVQHVIDKTQEAVGEAWHGHGKPQVSVQKQVAQAAPGGEDRAVTDPYAHPGGVGPANMHGGGTARLMDLKSGAEMSAHRKEWIEGTLEEPNPAHKRETLMDKVLHPLSRDALKKENALEAARSYYDYVEEKQQQQEAAKQAEKLGEQVKQAADEGVKGAKEAVGEAAAAVKGKLAQAKDAVSEKVSDVEHKASASNEHVMEADKKGRIDLAKSDVPFSERTPEPAPGQTPDSTHTAVGTNQHATGDVVTEVVSSLGQAVMDTGRGLMNLLVGARGPADTETSSRGVETGSGGGMVGRVGERTGDAPLDNPGLVESGATLNSGDVPDVVPGTATESGADPTTGAGHSPRPEDEEPGVTARIVGAIKDVFGAGPEHGGAGPAAGHKEGYERPHPAYEQSGVSDMGGYGRGVGEEGHHHHHEQHDIPVMPYTSTEELLRQRAQESQ